MFFVRKGATHKLLIGPVVAVANGYVPVTTLDLSTADEKAAILHDNGTVVSISAYTFAAVASADGYYHLTLQSGITNTVGHVTIAINDGSLCLPVKAEYTVLDTVAYDALFADGATGAFTGVALAADQAVNAAKIGGQTVTAGAGITMLASVGTAATSAAQTGDSYALANGASGFAAIKAETAAILTDTAEIGAAGAGLTALATAANLATVAGYLDTEIGAIKAKTDNLPAAPAAVGDIPTAAAVADAVWDEVLSGHAGVGSAGAALSAAGGSGDPWSTALPGAYGAGTAGQIIGAIIADTNELQTDWANGGRLDLILDARASQASVDVVDGNVDAILVDTAEIGAAGAGLTALATAADLATVAGYLDTEIGAIKAKTDNLPAAPAATGDIPSAGTITTAVLTTAVTEAYRADGAAPTLAQALCEVLGHLGESSIAGATKTVKKFDGSTTAATFTLDDATTPTSITRAT